MSSWTNVPVDYPAYHQARSRVLGLVSIWLMDEREKCDPQSDRWKALSDVSHELSRLQQQEVREPDTVAAAKVSHMKHEGGTLCGVPIERGNSYYEWAYVDCKDCLSKRMHGIL